MQEIERKFTINRKLWKPSTVGKSIKQGYLSITTKSVVRVRTINENAFLTIKGIRSGISRTELEYEIPKQEAEIMLAMCQDSIIEKMRYLEKIGNLTWEIDVFEGENQGLIIAEVELENEDQEIDLPKWINQEVSFDNRYYNSWLSKYPYTRW